MLRVPFASKVTIFFAPEGGNVVTKGFCLSMKNEMFSICLVFDKLNLISVIKDTISVSSNAILPYHYFNYRQQKLLFKGSSKWFYCLSISVVRKLSMLSNSALWISVIFVYLVKVKDILIEHIFKNYFWWGKQLAFKEVSQNKFFIYYFLIKTFQLKLLKLKQKRPLWSFRKTKYEWFSYFFVICSKFKNLRILSKTFFICLGI